MIKRTIALFITFCLVLQLSMTQCLNVYADEVPVSGTLAASNPASTEEGSGSDGQNAESENDPSETNENGTNGDTTPSEGNEGEGNVAEGEGKDNTGKNDQDEENNDNTEELSEGNQNSEDTNNKIDIEKSEVDDIDNNDEDQERDKEALDNSNTNNIADSELLEPYTSIKNGTDVGSGFIASGEFKNTTWSIDANGTLRVDGVGEVRYIYRQYYSYQDDPVYAPYDVPWDQYSNQITSAIINLSDIQSLDGFFSGCKNLKTVDLSGLDTSNTFDMCFMFSGCSSLTKVDLSSLDTSSVTDMSGMFCGCSSLSEIDLSGFKTITVTDMDSMFDGCSSLTELDLSSFDTSNVTNMNQMFLGCSEIIQLNVSSFTTAKVESMRYMFSGCNKVTSLDLSGFDTRNVVNMDMMFYNCYNIESLDLRSFNTEKVTNMSCMFYGCYSLKEILFLYVPGINNEGVVGFTTGSVINMGGMFCNCYELNGLDVSNFDTSNVFNMQGMFSGCSSLTELDLSNFDMSSVEYSMASMFKNCKKLRSIDLSSAYTSKVSDMHEMFYGCESLVDLDISNLDTSNVVYMNSMFCRCESLTTIDVSNFDTSKVENMSNMFNGCLNVEELDVSKWKIPNVKDMRNLFANCQKIKELYQSWWNFENVTDNSYMYYRCSSLERVYLSSSITHIDDRCFYCNDSWEETKLKDIYYAGEEESWNRIIVTGKNPQLYTATIHFGYIPSSLLEPSGRRQTKQSVVPKGKYGICVMDADDKPLSGVLVKYNSQENVTGDDGYVQFDLAVKPQITATKEGYLEWNNNNEYWSPNINRYEEIRLYDDSFDGGLVIKSAYYSSDKTKVDLLHDSVKVKLPDANDSASSSFTISCCVYNTQKVQEYELIQDNQIIATSQDGFFEIDTNDENISEGSGVYVLTTSSDSDERKKTPLNIKFYRGTPFEVEHFVLDRKGIKFTVPESVPFVGGSVQKFKLPDVFPIEAKHVDNKWLIGFNYRLDDDGKSKEMFDKLVDTVQKNGSIKFKDMKKLKKYMISQNKCHLFNMAIDDFKIYIMGYGEADAESRIAKIKLFILVEPDNLFELNYNTAVGIVPVTIQCELKGELKGGIECKYDFKKNDWADALSGNRFLDVSGELEAFGGVGVSKAVGVGAYGKAKLIGKMIFGSDFSGLDSLDLEGELGIKAYFALWEGKKDFAHDVWHLYKAKKKTDSGDGSRSSGNSWQSVTDASLYQRADLSYLNSESEWLGNTRGKHDVRGTSLNEMELKTLLSGTYRNAQPDMVADESGIYMTMLRADSTGKVYTTVSKYNGSVWSEPVRLNNEALLDDAPRICLDDYGIIWIAYTRVKGNTGDAYDDDLLGYANSRELVVARLNPVSLEVEQEKIYSGSGFVYGQDIDCINGTVRVAWMDSPVSTENDVLSPAAAALFSATVSEDGFGDACLMADVYSKVGQVVVGEYRGSIDGLAYTVIESGSDENYSLFWTDGNNQTKLADIGTGYVSYGHIPGSSGSEYMWNGQAAFTEDEDQVVLQALVGLSGYALPAEGITPYYDVAGENLYYSTGASLDSDDVYKTYIKEVAYENGSITNGVLQLANTRYFENVNAVQFKERQYLLGMNTSAEISDNDILISKDLVWGRPVDVSDVAITNVDYDISDMESGMNMPVTLEIENNSSHLINNLQVNINGDISIASCDIPVGKTGEIVVYVNYPESKTEYTLTASEYGAVNASDDNVIKFVLAAPDLTVDAGLKFSGEQRGIEAVVTNCGGTSASGTVKLYDKDENEYDSMEISSLDPGENYVASFWIPKEDKDQFVGDINVIVEMDGEEIYTSNNSVMINTLWDEETDDPEPQPDPLIYHHITSSSGAGGSISPLGDAEVIEGDFQDYMFTPDKGYIVGDVIVDGESIGAVSEYSFDDVSGDHTINVVFSPITYHIQYVGNGQIDPDTGVSDVYGTESIQDCAYGSPTTVSRRLFSKPGSEFTGWNTRPDGSGVAYYPGDVVTDLAFIQDATVTMYAQWTGMNTSVPKASISTMTTEDSPLDEGRRLYLSCDTQGADIYYVINGNIEDNVESGALNTTVPGVIKYTDSIALTSRIAGTDGSGGFILNENGDLIIEISAVAVTDAYGLSNSVSFSYYLKNNTKEWGELSDKAKTELGIDDTTTTSQVSIPDSLWVSGIENMPYTGSAIQLDELEVYFGRKKLIAGTDYTVKYSNNVKAGNATITITGKGNYAGSIVRSFAIEPLDLSAVDGSSVPLVKIPDISLVYNGKIQKGTTGVSYPVNGRYITLKAGTDFTYEYPQDMKGSETENSVYQVTVIGKGNYTGTATFNQTILKKDAALVSVGKLKISSIPAQNLSYGSYDDISGTWTIDANADNIMPCKPALTVKDGKTELTPYDSNTGSGDYSLEYYNNTSAGTASVVITGHGNYYGTKTISFKINGLPISKASLDLSAMPESNSKLVFAYTGSEITWRGEDPTSPGEVIPYYSLKYVPSKGAAAIELKEGRDYSVSYSNNVNAGRNKATVIFTGKGAYSGTLKKAFTISNVSFKNNDTENPDITVAWAAGTELTPDVAGNMIPNLTYVKGGVKPEPVITFTGPDGNAVVLKAGTDYTLKYSNNTSVNDCVSGQKKYPTVTITGKGNYSGSLGRTFAIKPSSLENCGVKISATDILYANKAGNCKTAVTLTDTNGTRLAAGTDYDKNFVYTYEYDTLVKQSKGDTSGQIRIAGSEVDLKKDYIQPGTVIRVTVQGKGNYAGLSGDMVSSIYTTFRVVGADISRATVKIADQTYTGRPIELSKEAITITCNKTALDKTDYEIVPGSFTNNINKGTASFVIRGQGNYGGTKTVKFKIVNKSMDFTVVYDNNTEYVHTDPGTDPDNPQGMGIRGDVIISGNVKSAVVKSGGKLAANGYKLANYSFAGWNTHPDGSGTAYAAKGAFVPDAGILAGGYGSSVTLYAQWIPVTYKITYRLNGGTAPVGEEANPATYAYGSNVDLNSPTRSGYTFAGWYYDSRCVNKPLDQVTDGNGAVSAYRISAGNTGAKTVYAKWIKNTP